jgi:hypothetical protein
MASVDDAIHEFCTLQKAWLETELHAGKNEEVAIPQNEDAASKSKHPRRGGADASSSAGERTGIIYGASKHWRPRCVPKYR